MKSIETNGSLADDFGEGLPIGERHYRAWVGPPEQYDKIGALQFNVLTALGLREHHSLLDIGCGSLRGGRLAIMYLRPERYFGIEPEAWVLEDGTRAHLGQQLLDMKRPNFSNDANYTLSQFDRQFDFLLAHSVFCHAPASQIARCLREARKVMAVTSVFIGTFLESDRNHVGDEWVYPWVTEYTRHFITERVEGVGLKCTHLDWPHPFDQKWFVATDPANEIDARDYGNGAIFSYVAYLREELEYYSGKKRKSYIEYLQNDLETHSKDKRKLPR